MGAQMTFDEVLDAVEHLPADQQSELVDVVRRRLAERGRQQVVDDVASGRGEFASGASRPVSADDLMREIES